MSTSFKRGWRNSAPSTRKRLFVLLASLLISVGVIACGDNEISDTPTELYAARTVSASPLSSSSAELTASLSTHLSEVLNNCNVGFVYGTHSNLTIDNATSVYYWSTGNEGYATQYSVTISGLKPNTVYYCCAMTRSFQPNRQGRYDVVYGNTIQFRTPAGNNGTEEEHPNDSGSMDNDSHIAIDLGLSVKWADSNIGASSPYAYGWYVCWGDVFGKSYEAGNDDAGAFSICGDEVYDIARYQWGRDWRLPTKNEMQELCDMCTWTRESRNGVNGFMVKGPNGNSIFLPAGGSGYQERISEVGDRGEYWTGNSAPSESASWTNALIYHYAYALLFWYSDNSHRVYTTSRHSRLLARPVKR